MKLVIITACLVACACAYPAADESTAETLENTYEIDPDGSYYWKERTSNNIEAEAQGSLKTLQDGAVVLVVQGRSEYKSPNGELISLSYTADENGYVPYGPNLPVAPPVPDAIFRALEYIKSRTAQE